MPTAYTAVPGNGHRAPVIAMSYVSDGEHANAANLAQDSKLLADFVAWLQAHVSLIDDDNTFTGDNTFQGEVNVPNATGPTDAINGHILAQLMMHNWTPRTLPTGDYYAIAYAPALNRYCCVGNALCATSDNGGLTWTTRTMPLANCWGVAWSPILNLFAAAGPNSSPAIATSPDGITWTTRAYAGDFASVFADSEYGRFCACSNVYAYTSNDGITWTQRSFPFANPFGSCACESGYMSLAVGPSSKAARGGNAFGTSWTIKTIPAGDYYGVAWSPTLGLAAAVGPNVCATTADGTTWTARTIPAGNYWGVAWNPVLEVFVAVGLNVCAFSADGITWTGGNGPASDIRKIAVAPNGGCVGAGFGSLAATSLKL